MSGREKVGEKVLLIDCDPGVDDCLALMMALTHIPKVKVVGITCANGNVDVDRVTLNAIRIVKLYDMIGKVPVFRGCDEPIIVMPHTENSTFYHGKDGLGDAPHVEPQCNEDLMKHIEDEHAVHAISRLSKEYNGRLQVVCLGALTNVALAKKLDPGLPKRLKSLHILGGTMRARGNVTPCAEYNFYTDPEAAYTVLRSFSGGCPIQLVTYDALTDHGVSADWFDELISGPKKRNAFFREISKKSLVYERKLMSENVSDGYIMCDAYLIGIVLDPSAVKKSRKFRMGVELAGHMARASLVIAYGCSSSPYLCSEPIELVEEINIDIYRDLVSKVFE